MKLHWNLLLGLVIGTLTFEAQAYLFTINVDAPDEEVPEYYTDFCVEADGGPGGIEFGSNIIGDYYPDVFSASHRLVEASVGWQDDELGGTDNNGLCFYFSPGDPVQPGETFSVVLDAAWLDGTEQSIIDGTETYGITDSVAWSFHTQYFLGVGGPVEAVGGINPGAPLQDPRPTIREPIFGCGPGCISKMQYYDAVPVPATLSLVGLGLTTLGFCRRKRRVKAGSP